jgi:glucokinase
MAGRHILVADIGGTRARFLRLDADGAALGAEPLDLSTREHRHLPELLATALHALGLRAVDCDAWFAVAGPVHAGRVRLTNLGWEVSETSLREDQGFRSAHLLNDLAAAAWCLGEAQPAPSRVLREAPDPDGGRSAVVSVSTGLGLAYWARLDGRLHVDATEGGHVGFSPGDPWETDYLRAMQQKHGHRISWERTLCGAGLAALEAHIRGGSELDSAEVARLAAAGDASASEAVRRFSRMLGVFVGDRVLDAPITGSIWLMGGVTAGLGGQLDRERFLEGLDAKGRMNPALTRLPVRITEDHRLGLRGAFYAARAFSA